MRWSGTGGTGCRRPPPDGAARRSDAPAASRVWPRMICASAVSAWAVSPSRSRRSASRAMASRTLSVASPFSRATSVWVRSVTVSRRQAAASCGRRSSRASRVCRAPVMRAAPRSPCPVSAASAARLLSARAIRDWSCSRPWSATRRDSCQASAAVRRSPYLDAASPRWLEVSLRRCRSCPASPAGPSRSAARSCQSATVRRASATQRRCRVSASSRTRTTTALAFASARGSVRRLATAASAVSALSRSRGSAPASRVRSRSNHIAARPRASRSTGPSWSARQVRNVISDSRDALSVTVVPSRWVTDSAQTRSTGRRKSVKTSHRPCQAAAATRPHGLSGQLGGARPAPMASLRFSAVEMSPIP